MTDERSSSCRRAAPRSRGTLQAIGALVAAALGLASGRARAEPARARLEPIRIVYEERAGCPTLAELHRAIELRASSFRVARWDEPARVATFTMGTADEGMQRGRLIFEELDGTVFTRELSEKSCRDLVSALALVAALAIEGGAPEPHPSSRPPPHSRPVASKPPGARLASTASERWVFAAGAHVGMIGAVAPGLSFGPLVFVDWGANALGIAPSFRLTAALAGGAMSQDQPADASFRWAAGRLAVCPFRLAASALSFRPCAEIGAGVLHGDAGAIPGASSGSSPWFDIAAIARGQWVFADGMGLELSGGALAPLVRDQFVYRRPPRVIHEVPVLGVLGSLGLVVSFL